MSQYSSTVFKLENNTYDVFVGKGYDNHVRIQWDRINKKWSAISGRTDLLVKAVQLFNREMKG